MLAVGEKAPDFTARTTAGATLALRELRGRWVVLYFFPKAFTAG
jgi:peroxiredoxin Q/BCP